MPPRNRSLGRDVHIYDVNDRTTVLGGLILTNGVTNANFYSMVEIIVFHLIIPRLIFAPNIGSFSVNNESWLVRIIFHASGTRTQSFRDTVRSRDRRCVVFGEVAVDAQFDYWDGFEAAHIFPIAYEDHWEAYSYNPWITILPDKGGTINSLFDSYSFSINPDDNYKVVFFRHDGKGLAGKHLDRKLLDNPQRPVDQLLRWHFGQAVLANMRGAGEPVFEHDFLPGSDIAVIRGIA
ncbi:hypothetical protein P152DRAFT_465712 [Eremomyces bilateralis CBS 781.70]|uniref:DUF7881 domain-containing protein n=1 Tax=Eremomyces bilateralis CBS 781.70 TaxID=1392243 RepID=A0A6G1G7U4_9PEZI|nr:uncharacterized protein P152DRAFT_465712 [Eremomyces bilateralis CBS 781.70]KAF1813960.1 hypothetical protein P152DRAFT_465712 [Eremomyces bilateralis CBS 781.70]